MLACDEILVRDIYLIRVIEGLAAFAEILAEMARSTEIQRVLYF